MLSQIEELTSQFYQWEKRGRGWKVFNYPVDLEPPFVPFFYHDVVRPSQYVDDGKKPTILGSIADFFRNGGRRDPSILTESIPEEKIEAYPHTDDAELVGWKIVLPKGRKAKMDEAEHLLLMLSSCDYPVSFEIIGTGTFVRIQFICREPDSSLAFSQLKAFFPDCVLIPLSIGDGDFDIFDDQLKSSALDLGLKEEFVRPLATNKSLDPDTLTGIFGVLEHLQKGERGVLQVLFKGTVNSWSESIIRSVMDNEGGSFFLDDPHMVKLAQEKISSPLFGASIRVLGQAQTLDRAQTIKYHLAQSLQNVTRSQTNSLVPLPIEGYMPEDFLEDLMLRTSHRLGMLLNSRELLTFLHLPGQSVISSRLERDTKKSKQAPKITDGHDFVLGINNHQGEERVVSVSKEQRLRHTHIIGATGTGKSSFLLTCIAQDMKLGNGVAVLDPHGDLIENVIPYIPVERVNDVIIIDPSDSEFPVGFNILTAHSEVEKDILSSDLVAVFKRLSTSWGDQMNSVFANAILAFLESTEGGTLMDLRRFLIEKPFRDQFLKTVTDPSIVYYWLKEFPILKSSSIGPILTRLDAFLRPKLIRNMVGQKKSLDFENILDSQKIVLIKLSQGLIGAENSYLLGTFIVSKIQQAAMARQAKHKDARSDFFLYIDEFQNFITPSMATILSGARKYHLGLVLAHQDMQQLMKQDSELASSVISNAGTRLCFRIGDIDAKKLAEGFSSFEALDFQNLGLGEVIGRIDRPEYDFNLTTIQLPEFEPENIQAATSYVIQAARDQYGTPKSEVEGTFQSLQLDTFPVHEINAAVQARPPAERPVLQTLEIERRSPKEEKPSQHRYLQTLIKKMAESRGFTASLEQPTPDGKGRVDVSLERNGRRIAVEIQDTTKDDWELQNIEKCLNADYDLVVECSKERKTVDRLQKKVEETFEAEFHRKILVMLPEDFFLFIDSEIAKEASGEARIKGYRVKTEFNAVPDNEAQRMREAIAKSVLRSERKNP